MIWGKDMKTIFTKEDKLIAKAEKLIKSNSFKSLEDEEEYRALLDEYKSLLKQVKRIIKMSDKTQTELKAVSEKLNVISHIDALTDLYNRRHFDEVLQKEWHSALRSKDEIALVMIDIDYFKKYNDTYGHIQGDKCLKRVADIIKAYAKRPRDIVARFGGEEFMIILPETKIKGAVRVGKDILTGVENMKIEHSASPLKQQILTVSIGIASISPSKESSIEELLTEVDKALYTAKNSGRNCLRPI